ncbi:NUDIX hydrolase [Crassisporium funariophilum]|nr:NUDIX hydrolase [Crassisporium funariophilum]
MMQLSDESLACIMRLSTYFASPEHHSRASYLESEPHSKLASVLVLLYEQAGNLRVLLTTRAKALRTHGGQTSLPGGKAEETDEDVIATAYREAFEEVSLPLTSPHIHTLGTLEPHPFHQLIVTPVVAFLTDNTILQELKASEREVQHIFTHPLEAILAPNLAAQSETLVPHGGEHWPYESEHHQHIDHVVKALGNMTYRLHCFQTSASPITGMTADVLPTLYERYAEGQLRSYEEITTAFKANQEVSVTVKTS